MRMSLRYARILSAFFTGLALLSTPAIAQEPPSPSALPFMNSALPVDQRVTDLIGRMGVGFVTGMQGQDPKFFRVISTPKHYAVHSGPEPLRHRFNVDVSPHDLEDTYLPAFRAAVTEAHAQSIMCAYNAIDGAPACANTMLLRDHLRDDWHFDGYVVSDCAAVADINTGHHYAPDMAHAAAAAVKAGTDIECGFAQGQAFPALVDAVHQNLITEAELDTSLRRLFSARVRLGMFDPPNSFAYGRIPFTEDNSAAHRQLSLQADDHSMQGRTYRFFSGDPLYRFGYGLSYTSFGYGGLKLLPASVKAGEPVTVEAQVKNIGTTAGDEVAQLYLTQPKGFETPLRLLVGFTRIHLGPGESSPVHLTIDPRSLGQVDAQGNRLILPGVYTVSVGGSQPGKDAQVLTGTFTITGQSDLPK